MKFVTFNIRCSWDGDGINSFLHRAGGILQKIRTEAPDVVCFQEVTDPIAAFLRQNLTGYHLLFNQRNADYRGEGLAIALKNDSTELLGLESFWLSPTPDVPGSRYEEQSRCPRICQAALIRCENVIFRAYNLHLDHVSDSARCLGMEAALKKMIADREKNDFPILLCGDFNATPESAAIALCNECTEIDLTEVTSAIPHTYHAFGGRENPLKIDYIFTDAATAAHPHTVTPWTDETDGIYLSDHFPIQLEIEL